MFIIPITIPPIIVTFTIRQTLVLTLPLIGGAGTPQIIWQLPNLLIKLLVLLSIVGHGLYGIYHLCGSTQHMFH